MGMGTVMDTRKNVSAHISFNKKEKEEILEDYRLAYRSRQVSLVGRREVLSGKAKFGIFGDGKEVVQVAMARVTQPGDWRSGYYRDQTLIFATGEATIQQFFAQLYAHAEVEADPATAGRAMNAHFATRSLDSDGSWKDLLVIRNSSADVSPTASQMPRLVGLAYASRLYRELDELKQFSQFSHNGDEVAFGTIGNASCAEGMFWEAVNAIGVLKSPAILTIYDDGYGISVTNEFEMVKGDLSELLKGFQRQTGTKTGYDLYHVKGWDYPALVEVYRKAAEIARRDHVPAILHATELTQPLGHSTSGSQERYKSPERLHWEQKNDCLKKFRQWIIDQEIAAPQSLDEMEGLDRQTVEEARKRAWEEYLAPIQQERQHAAGLIDVLKAGSAQAEQLAQVSSKLLGFPAPLRRDIMTAVREALLLVKDEATPARQALAQWKRAQVALNETRYDSHLYSQSEQSALQIPVIPAAYSDQSPLLYGFEVVNACFDAALGRDPR
ncbi:MAG TPA: thiamine pyrophosphate-dependent enzyme, partial [Anaerolineales bacterium]